MSKSDDQVSLRERVKVPPSEVMVRAYFAPKLQQEVELCFDAEMEVHLAHGLMLAKQGIVNADDMRQIMTTVLDLADAGPSTLSIDYSQEDLYSYVERYIVSRLGADVGGRLHTGRSRNDLHTTTWRMVLRQHLIDVLLDLITLRRTLLDMASEHVETVMPGYTHSQHAQPITLGYYLLTVADLMRRDTLRIMEALNQVDRSPLGAGALTTSGFPIDREATCHALGFPRVVEVAYDAVACRDDVHQSAAALAILMTNLSRLSFDLQNWNSMEYGFIELADEFSSVSSIMPQKKNPHPLEHIKATTGHVSAALVDVLSCTKNTSLSDVNDGVSAINVPVLDATSRTSLSLQLITGVLETLSVNAEKMLYSAAIGFGTATELADVIVRETGLSFRMAHNIVGNVVNRAISSGKKATELSSGDLVAAAQELFGLTLEIDESVIQAALDPLLNVRVRTVLGGPAPDNMRSMLQEREKELADDASLAADTKDRVSKSSRELRIDVANFIARAE